MICSDHVIYYIHCHSTIVGVIHYQQLILFSNKISCSIDMLPYSFNPHLHNNVSNVTSNVNFSPTILNQLDGFSLVDYPIDNVCVIVCVRVCVCVCGHASVCMCMCGRACHSVRVYVTVCA